MPDITTYPSHTLSPSGEKAWSEFLRHVQWPDGFALIFLFSSIPATVITFRDRLTRVLATSVSTVQIIAPEGAGQITEQVLDAVRSPDDRYESLHAPLWIEANRDGDPDWHTARYGLLARLNEHRDLMRSRLHRPVIIVLPAGFRPQLREAAPDLWSVRNYSNDLDEIRALDTGTGDGAATGPDRTEPAPVSRNAEALLKEWDRLGSRNATGRDVLISGLRALDAALSLGRHELARSVAQKVLKLARQAVSDGGAPTALRDLSVSLNKVGDTARRMGYLAEAEAAYGESLQIRRDLVASYGATPESLRDLSVSLDNVGDTARRMGNLAEAEAAYSESLQISRDLVANYGTTPESLRDLSVSLDNVGDTARRMGNLAEAEAAYGESLQISRDLIANYGATPESLRDLSVSLNKVGDTARRMGNLAEAEAAYVESLQIRRDLVASYGATPESLRDLSVSLDKVGDTARRMGNLVEAEAAYVESLQIIRDLVANYGATPESLRDLSVSLDKVGDTARRMGNLAEAEAAYVESLQIIRDLVANYGTTPESLRDLSVSLNKVGDTARRMGNLAEAEAACRENIMVLRRLIYAFPGMEEYREMLQHAETMVSELQDKENLPPQANDQG